MKITRIAFDTIDITSIQGGQYTINDSRGFSPASRSNYENIPRTNYRQYISAYNTPAVRLVDFLLRGAGRTDFLQKLESFYKYEQTIQTFTVYMEEFTGGVGSSVITREFDGLIEEIELNGDSIGKVDHGDITMKISSTTRYLRNPVETIETAAITPGGFIFPFTFPFTFSGASNTISLTNNGTADTFPVFTLTGGGTEWNIQSDNSALTDPTFSYTAAIGDNVDVVIDPAPNVREKALSEGISVIGNTNFNWEALVVPAGQTVTFTINIASGFTANTLISASFKELYKY